MNYAMARKDHTTTCQNPETPSSPSPSSHYHLIPNNPDYVQHCHYPPLCTLSLRPQRWYSLVRYAGLT